MYTTRGKAFCVYCQYCSSKGLLNLAKKFAQHSQSDLHNTEIELSARQENVYSLLSSQAMADQKIRREMLLMQLSSLKYLLWQGLAIRGHEDIRIKVISYSYWISGVMIAVSYMPGSRKGSTFHLKL